MNNEKIRGCVGCGYLSTNTQPIKAKDGTAFYVCVDCVNVYNKKRGRK